MVNTCSWASITFFSFTFCDLAPTSATSGLVLIQYKFTLAWLGPHLPHTRPETCTSLFLFVKHYTPFIVIIKYWLYSPWCTIYSCRLFYTQESVATNPYPLVLLPLLLVTTNLLSTSVSQLFCYFHKFVAFFRFHI